MTPRLIAGDCLGVMREMAERGETAHAVVTDPPYHLLSTVERFGKEGKTRNEATVGHAQFGRLSRGFMGKTWDGGDIAFRPETWRLVYDLLPPGGHLVAFGGTRTFHRMAVAIEDAGFELRDTLMWLYGTGFPKSHDVSKGIDKMLGTPGTFGEPKSAAHAGGIDRGQMRGDANEEGWQRPWMDDPEQVANAARRYIPGSPEAAEWSGWGTALKPAWEPIILARKPLAGTVAANVLAHRTGALNVDGCRVAMGAEYDPAKVQRQQSNRRTWEGGEASGFAADHVQATYSDKGRWPANVLHDGSDEVEAAFAAFGERPGQQGRSSTNPETPKTRRVYGAMGHADEPMEPRGDTGSASRFFFNTGGIECDPANTAGASLPLQSEHAVFALSGAATSARPGAVLLAGSYQAVSTSVTASEFGMLCASVTEAIQSFDRRRSLGLPPVRHTVTLGPATCVVQPGPTGTTTIMASLLRCAGSADLVTFSITPPNTDPGEADSLAGSRFHYSAKATAADRAGSKHPTVKPVALMRWLVRLVCPPGGTVLDPFAGSGSTGAAAIAEGMQAVLIEAEAEYQADIRRRFGLAEPRKQPVLAAADLL